MEDDKEEREVEEESEEADVVVRGDKDADDDAGDDKFKEEGTEAEDECADESSRDAAWQSSTHCTPTPPAMHRKDGSCNTHTHIQMSESAECSRTCVKCMYVYLFLPWQPWQRHHTQDPQHELWVQTRTNKVEKMARTKKRGEGGGGEKKEA